MISNIDIIDFAKSYLEESDLNYISEDQAINKDMVGLKIFDEPLLAFAQAKDPMFNKLKEDKVVGDHHLDAESFLKGSKSVISIFLPFTKEIKESNQVDRKWPSPQWRHGRVEGQECVLDLINKVKEVLEKAGYQVVVPITSDKFESDNHTEFTSNWSERHIAFIAGLGTFGLSKGLITKKGVAGRYCSLVTDAVFDYSQRDYEEYDQYCSMCGDCIKKCPVNAISFEEGKKHLPCANFLSLTKEKYNPWYGCGKCQVGVSCQDSNPSE